MPVASLFQVAFRVDSSAEIGVGHLMRCLTLAKIMRDSGGTSLFLCRDLPGNSCHLINEADFELVLLSEGAVSQDADARESIKALDSRNPCWVVTDHYDLGQAWQRMLRASGYKLVAFEDIPGRRHDADVIIDQTPSRKPAEYVGLTLPDCNLLLGAKYALLRTEFSKLRPHSLKRRAAFKGAPKNILVSLGGGETSEAILAVTEALALLSRAQTFRATLVLGNSQIREAEIRAAAANLPYQVEVVSYAENMAERLAAADIAIGAAGGSALERCSLGVPSILLVLADNQKMIAHQLADAGAAALVPPKSSEIASALSSLMDSPDQLWNMTESAARLCDGCGAARVRSVLLESLIDFRAARIEDAEFIWQARYGDSANVQYRNPKVPQYSEHLVWLGDALADPRRLLWVATIEETPIGHIRIDVSQETPSLGELSLYLTPEMRGRALGTAMLMRASKVAFTLGFEQIYGEVKLSNPASLRSFEAAGFERGDTREGGFVTFAKSTRGEEEN